MLGMLCLIRSLKNSFTPINRIPPEVLSLIPNYYGEDHKDGDLIALTHVCRGWRDTFTSRSSLWTRLDFKSVSKTRTYIRRSQSSPLEIYIGRGRIVDEAFLLITPHIFRLKSLTIDADSLPIVLEHFRCHAPLLEKLDISFYDGPNPVLGGTLFGDLSLLREFSLDGIIADFPWKNMANLRVVKISSCPRIHGTTELLHFLESALLLHTVTLMYKMPDSSDAPPGRVVHLSHLKAFTLGWDYLPYSVLLRHLHIPVRASLVLEYMCYRPYSLPRDLKRSPNFDNLSHITAINVLFTWDQKGIQLSGPSGSLRATFDSIGSGPSAYVEIHQILRSLDHPMLSTIQRLVISGYQSVRSAGIGECRIFKTLSSTNNLRTLILVDCRPRRFVRALDPRRNPSNFVVCPNMRELVLHVSSMGQLGEKRIISMAKNRASRGVKFSSITIVGLSGFLPEETLLKLREHVAHVGYRVGHAPPAWDDVPNESGGESEWAWG